MMLKHTSVQFFSYRPAEPLAAGPAGASPAADDPGITETLLGACAPRRKLRINTSAWLLLCVCEFGSGRGITGSATGRQRATRGVPAIIEETAVVRHCLCSVLPPPSWLRHCLCSVLPPPSWL